MQKTKSEKREFIKWNQSKMGMDGMYLKKVILPLLKKKAENTLSANGKQAGFEPDNRGSNPCKVATVGRAVPDWSLISFGRMFNSFTRHLI